MLSPETAAPDARAPLLVFDSGVGGLSVLERIRQHCPAAPIVYAMDRAGYPYGMRDDADLAGRIPALLGRLVERYRPRLLVIACNTASTIAINAVRHALDIPVVGTVPAIKTAATRTRTGVIGVLGTHATIRQPYLDQLIDDFAPDCTILRHGAPALVDLAEARLVGDTRLSPAASNALSGLHSQTRGRSMDTVVLACTHFPLVAHELAAAAASDLQFVDSSDAIARRVAALTCAQSWPARRPRGIVASTGPAATTQILMPALARFGLMRLDTF
ncbi:glutamate racemase [Salinisphaera aquimarina]|uniref:Glutamate racemase n=1 Tax=Salinisphaera aquimarina TaxID=2094031 RepID=A0ABV7ETM3_9GAMM